METVDPWSLSLSLLEEARRVPLHEALLNIIDPYLTRIGGESRIFWLPALQWRLVEASCEPCGAPGFAPYVSNGDVEGAVALVRGDPSEPSTWKRYPGAAIAVATEPPRPYLLGRSALLAADAGAEALIVCSRGPLRRVPVTGSPGFSFHAGAPPPIPVVYVSSEGCTRVLELGRARIYVDARVEERYLSGVEVRLPGRGAPWIFGAHLDHLGGGFQEAFLPVSQAASAGLALASQGVEARILLFPAGEYGAPGYAGWYWGWGSRFYAIQLWESNLSGAYSGFIGFYYAGSGPLRASGSPPLAAALQGIQAEAGECPECDGAQLALHAGLPTVSIHSLWGGPATAIHHSPEDTPENADPEESRTAVRVVLRALVEGVRWDAMERFILNTLSRGPLEARRAAAIILGASKRIGWKDLYPRLARACLRPVLYGGTLRVLWCPEVALYEELVRAPSKGPAEVRIAGWEESLYILRSPYGSGYCDSRCLAEQARSLIAAMSERVEDAVRESLA